MEFEEAIKKFEETGICDWCNGTGEIVENAGMNGEDGRFERTEKCPVCKKKEEDIEQDRELENAIGLERDYLE